MPTTDNIPPDIIFPPLILPVALNNPFVNTLPPAILPVTFKADTTLELKLSPPAFKFPPVMLPLALTTLPNKLVPVIVLPAEIMLLVNKFPPIILPLALIKPLTYSPVVANIATLVLATPIVTLALAVPILTLLVPF